MIQFVQLLACIFGMAKSVLDTFIFIFGPQQAYDQKD